MMFRLTCEIRVGHHRFLEVNEVKVKRSIYSFVDIANIRIPTSAMLIKSGELPTASAYMPGDIDKSEKYTISEERINGVPRRVLEKSGTFFNVGDPVEIWLGYDGELKLEFQGFVKKVNLTTPCELECEGYSWKLRNKVITKEFPSLEKIQEQRTKDPTNKNPVQTSVKEILAYIIQDTGIVLSDKIPDIQLDKMNFNGETGPDALERLKKEVFLTIYFNGPELYAGLAYTQLGKAAAYKTTRQVVGKGFDPLVYKEVKDPVKFGIGSNLVSSDQLKFRRAVDVPIQVRAIRFTSKNVKVEKTVGGKGDIRTFFVPNVGSIETMEQVALSILNRLSYDGYEGKVTAFLQPFALPGFSASLTDKNYPEKDGVYVVDSTELTFGAGGGRRVCGIGVKISKKDEQATGTTNTGTKKA